MEQIPRTSQAPTLAEEVRRGLSKEPQKELPTKLLYDDIGSALFEVICLLPEYGLTRAGQRLFARHAPEMAAHFPDPVVVAELGSGSGRKTRFLLEALARRQPVTYCPIDISRAALAICERELSEIRRLYVLGFEAAYLDGLAQITARRREDEAILVLFLGSTIGNFDRPAGAAFVRQVRRALRPGDALLIGADLVKSVDVLRRAYDDAIGVTAAFDLNVLARLNREMGADFDLSTFVHEARWDERERRIEMHLVSRRAQSATVAGAGVAVALREGESIWTESSHKFTKDEVRELGRQAGFEVVAEWIDHEWPFLQVLFRVG